MRELRKRKFFSISQISVPGRTAIRLLYRNRIRLIVTIPDGFAT